MGPRNAVGTQYLNLLPTLTITTAISATAGTVVPVVATGSLAAAKYLVVEAIFVYGSGGTSADVYVQTSLDQGVTWIDIMEFGFTTASAKKIQAVTGIKPLLVPTTPGDGALTANTAVDGIIGNRFRVKYVTVGTYGGSTTLQVVGIARN